MTAPGGNTVHTLKGTSGDKFEFKAPRSGMYKFCFHNPYSTPETVSFYIHVGHIPSEHDLAKDGLSCSYLKNLKENQHQLDWISDFISQLLAWKCFEARVKYLLCLFLSPLQISIIIAFLKFFGRASGSHKC